jgi:hypothetical protein
MILAGGAGLPPQRVWRDERRERHELTHGLDCIVIEQPVAAGGDHDRVEHDMFLGVAAQEVRDGTDDVGVGKHADLDHVEPDIGHQRLELLDDELRWYDVHSGHAPGVLGGQSRDHGRAVGAQRRERLEVCLDAGPPDGSLPAMVRATGGLLMWVCRPKRRAARGWLLPRLAGHRWH